MSWSTGNAAAYNTRAGGNRSTEHVAQSMQGLGIHQSPRQQDSAEYGYSPAGGPATHSAPAQLQHPGGYPPSSHSPLVPGYPRLPSQPQTQAARNRQPLYAQTVHCSPNDSAYLPSPLESPSFAVQPSASHSPNVSVGGPFPGPPDSTYTYDGSGVLEPNGQQAQNDLYPFNSRPPDMSTSLSSAWSYPMTTPPSSAASSFRQCVSRSTSPSAASVMSAYSSTASSASAPQGFRSASASARVRSSPYHFRNRATSTPSLVSTVSTASSSASGASKAPTPRSTGKIINPKVAISGDRSAAQRNKAKLTEAQKKEICQLKLETPNMRQDDLAARFGVERSTVSKILKDTARWMNPAAWLPERRKEPSASTSVPITRFVELEGPLTIWLHEQKASPADQVIKDRALQIAQSLGWPADKFKASSGWLDGFKARHDLFNHSATASSNNTPSASSSRRTSPVKKVASPMKQVVSAELASGPSLKEGFEYTARKRSSSSVSLRSNVPALPTVLEDGHLIAQPLPRRAGQLGRSESLAMMASMESVSLASSTKGTPTRPGISPLTPASSAGRRPLPPRSFTFPTIPSSAPVTPASAEALGVAPSMYLTASPNEPPPPTAPFEARRHHQRLHSQSSIISPSSYQLAEPVAAYDGNGVHGWISPYPSPEEQTAQQYPHNQHAQVMDHVYAGHQPYAPTPVDHSPAMYQTQSFPDLAVVDSAPLDHTTVIYNDDSSPMLLATSDGRHSLQRSPSHSAVPSRLASPTAPARPSFPRTRSYTASSLAQTSNYDATYEHSPIAHSYEHMPLYEQPPEPTEVCFEWGNPF